MSINHFEVWLFCTEKLENIDLFKQKIDLPTRAFLLYQIFSPQIIISSLSCEFGLCSNPKFNYHAKRDIIEIPILAASTFRNTSAAEDLFDLYM